MSPKLLLCDQDPQVLEAWKAQFVKWPEVRILDGDPLEAKADAFLLPGNSFGFLDRGLKLRAVEAHGWEIQDNLRQRIRHDCAGELLVGETIVLKTSTLPRPIIYAPIYRTPGPLAETVHVFLAVRGAFLAMKNDPDLSDESVLCVPSMGVPDPGKLDPRVSARQIRYAFEMATGKRGLGDKNLSQLIRRQRKLQSIPMGSLDESRG